MAVFLSVVASIFGHGRAAVAMSMSASGWIPGSLIGTPVAVYLLLAALAKGAEAIGGDINAYRRAIFYAV